MAPDYDGTQSWANYVYGSSKLCRSVGAAVFFAPHCMGKRAGSGLSSSPVKRPAAAEGWDPWSHDVYLRTLLGDTPGLGRGGVEASVLRDHNAVCPKPIQRWLHEARSTALTREQLSLE